MFNGIWRDLAYAARSLAKARAFTFVCVVSLGIGMALVIAIPYWARVLRMPPPGVKTEGLVQVVAAPHGTRGGGEAWSYPDFEALRDSDTGIAIIGWTSGTSIIAIETPAGVSTESVATMFVSANYFRTIGVPLARGAGFDQTADDRGGRPRSWDTTTTAQHGRRSGHHRQDAHPRRHCTYRGRRRA
jgi:hypothetical protein